MKTYRISYREGEGYYRDIKHYHITEEGAKIIWAAYTKLYGNCQTMDRREERGGVCWLSELDIFKKEGALAADFDYTKYLVTPQPEQSK